MTTTIEIQQTWLDIVETLTTELEDGTTPEQWIAEGFSFEEASWWRQVGAFDPQRTKELIDAGFSPDELDRKGNEYSLAYQYCNNDLSIEDVRAAIA